MASFLDAWVHHWGWLWMLVGLCGYVCIVVVLDD